MKSFLLLLLVYTFFPGEAQAHKVNLFASIESGTVYGECYFVDGSPCKSATVSAVDTKSGETFFSGSTNAQGGFSFSAPKDAVFKIVAEAGAGHRAEYLVEEKETSSQTLSRSSQKAEEEEMEKILERILDKKLQPLKEQLVSIRKQMERPTLERVLAGMGWIAGIFGLYVLIAAKKKGC